MPRVRSLFAVVLAFSGLAACSSGEESIGTALPDTGTDATTSDGSPDGSLEDSADAPVDTGTDTPDTTPPDTADAGDDAEVDTGIDAGPSCASTPIGRPCSSTQPCPDPYICYGFGDTGFCAPPTPECGGFVMKECTGGRTCLRASGSSLGYCATSEEMPCICKPSDAGKIDGC